MSDLGSLEAKLRIKRPRRKTTPTQKSGMAMRMRVPPGP